MSRIAKEPVELPQGVEFKQESNVVTIKGSKGSLLLELNTEVELAQEEGAITVAPRSGSRISQDSWKMRTMRSVSGIFGFLFVPTLMCAPISTALVVML